MLDKVSDFCRKLIPIFGLVVLVFITVKFMMVTVGLDRYLVTVPTTYGVSIDEWPEKYTFGGKKLVPLPVEILK